MVWAAASAVVSASNNKGNAHARAYRVAAILSNNPFLVTLRTFVAQIPCNHWRSAETVSRGGSAWQGVARLLGASGRLSGAITAANQSGQATLWARPEFSLFSTLNSPSIVCINCNDGLIHRPRHFRGGANTISATRLASHSSATGKHYLSHPRVSITQAPNVKASHNGSKCHFETNDENGINGYRQIPSHSTASVIAIENHLQ